MDFGPGPPRGKAALAWLVPWVGTAVMYFVSPALEDGIGFARASAIALLVGLPLGVVWYLIYPRRLASRLLALLALTSLLVLIFGFADLLGSELSRSVIFTPLGIVTGLAFAEVRATRRQSPTAAHQPARAARAD